MNQGLLLYYMGVTANMPKEVSFAEDYLGIGSSRVLAKSGRAAWHSTFLERLRSIPSWNVSIVNRSPLLTNQKSAWQHMHPGPITGSD